MPKQEQRQKESYPYLRYVVCQVEPGIFEDEYRVSLQGVDPSDPGGFIDVEVLVDREEVAHVRGEPARGAPADGWLRVAVSSVEAAPGFVAIVLPQPAIPVGSAMVVKKDLVLTREALSKANGG